MFVAADVSGCPTSVPDCPGRGPGRPARAGRSVAVLSSRPRRVDPSRMTIRTPPSRTTTPVAPRRSAPDALVVRRGEIVAGRARGAAPLRREGPASSRARRSTPTTSCSPAPGTARRSDRPRPTPGSSRSTSTPRSTGRRSSSSPPPTSPARTSSVSIKRRPAGARRRSAARSATTPSRVALLAAAGSRDAPGRPTPDHRAARSRCRPSSTRSSVDHVFAHYEVAAGRPRRRLRRRRPRPRGHVPRRPPGAAVHREQRDDRGAARGRRRRRPRLAPVPVLRPQGAEAGAPARRRAGAGRPGGDRRRVRGQGGVPLDHRHPRRAARLQGRQARCG